MKTTKLLALTGLAAVSIVALSGCFQLPTPTPTTPTTPTDPTTPTTPTESEPSNELVGTSWSGTDNAGNVMSFTIAEDGTLDDLEWNGGGPWDEPADTWSLNGSTFEFYISNIEEIGGITYSGPAATGSMNLNGTSDLGGNTYTLVLTQG